MLEYLGAEWLLRQWLAEAPAFCARLQHDWWEPHVLLAGLLDRSDREALVLSILSQGADRRATFLAIACAGVESGVSDACLMKIRAALSDVAQAGLLPEDEATLIQLGKVGGPSAVALVAELFDLANPSVALGCVRILGKIGTDTGAMPLIERALPHRDRSIAEASATELKRVCTNVSPKSLDRLAEAFGWFANWDLALDVAAAVRTPAMVECLIRHLSDSGPLTLAGCLWVIGHSMKPNHRQTLVPLIVLESAADPASPNG